MAVKNKDRNLFGGGGRTTEDDDSHFANRALEKEMLLEVEELEKEIDELRASYELFFLGVEKIEPQPQRDLVKAKLRRWRERKPQNTALRFRIQQLKARMVSLENYWQRTVRQREAGTYHRDKARVKRREAERLRKEALEQASKKAAVEPVSDGTSVASADLKQSSGAEPPKKPAIGSHRPRATSAEDLTDAKLRKLYETYLGARRRCGESTDLGFDEMASALRRQVPRLISKTGASSVEFKVVIRSGKAVLKALPRAGA